MRAAAFLRQSIVNNLAPAISLFAIDGNVSDEIDLDSELVECRDTTDCRD